MNKSVGYARVSTKEQNLERQIKALSKYVDESMIVTDKASGKDLNRPGYQSLKYGIGKLTEGDTLYIKSIDRLSRNKEQAKEELRYYQQIGVRVKILDIPTTMADIQPGQEWIIDMINNIIIEVLSSVAENERQTIRQRQREGYDAMKPLTGNESAVRPEMLSADRKPFFRRIGMTFTFNGKTELLRQPKPWKLLI